MHTLVIGASGATGKHLVNQLLQANQKVKIIVRPAFKVPEVWRNNRNLSVITAEITEINVIEMTDCLSDCNAVASCLGHNISFKGIFGKPRKLVTDAVALICESIYGFSPENPVRFVLMNTTANRNKDLNEKNSIGRKIVIGLVRLFLPPQSDNEDAAEYLRVNVGQDSKSIEWVIVRPDTLIDRDEVRGYELYPSPVRNPVFNPGKSSRINVGNFMSRLIVDNDLWNSWKGRMPVIYDKTD